MYRYYCPAGSSIYKGCPGGYYCPSYSSSYTVCPAGYYCPSYVAFSFSPLLFLCSIDALPPPLNIYVMRYAGFDNPVLHRVLHHLFFSLKVLLDLQRLRHGHLFTVNFVELHELPHRPIPVEHRLLLLLQLPWRPVSERGCSDELQGVSRGEWSSFAILP